MTSEFPSAEADHHATVVNAVTQIKQIKVSFRGKQMIQHYHYFIMNVAIHWGIVWVLYIQVLQDNWRKLKWFCASKETFLGSIAWNIVDGLWAAICSAGLQFCAVFRMSATRLSYCNHFLNYIHAQTWNLQLREAVYTKRRKTKLTAQMPTQHVLLLTFRIC